MDDSTEFQDDGPPIRHRDNLTSGTGDRRDVQTAPVNLIPVQVVEFATCLDRAPEIPQQLFFVPIGHRMETGNVLQGSNCLRLLRCGPVPKGLLAASGIQDQGCERVKILTRVCGCQWKDRAGRVCIPLEVSGHLISWVTVRPGNPIARGRFVCASLRSLSASNPQSSAAVLGRTIDACWTRITLPRGRADGPCAPVGAEHSLRGGPHAPDPEVLRAIARSSVSRERLVGSAESEHRTPRPPSAGTLSFDCERTSPRPLAFSPARRAVPMPRPPGWACWTGPLEPILG